jgi:hypothetical protein
MNHPQRPPHPVGHSEKPTSRRLRSGSWPSLLGLEKLGAGYFRIECVICSWPAYSAPPGRQPQFNIEASVRLIAPGGDLPEVKAWGGIRLARSWAGCRRSYS